MSINIERPQDPGRPGRGSDARTQDRFESTVRLTGRLTREPDLYALADGTYVCQMLLAVEQMGRDGTPGFINVMVAGRTAGACADSLRQGWLVTVAGRLQYGEWRDAAGHERSGHSINAVLVEPKGFSSGHGAAVGSGA